MALGLGPWNVNFPVKFYSGGDTTREAFSKHIKEIDRIYGILKAIDAAAVTSDSLNGTLGNFDKSLQEHINSTNPHPNWKPSISFDDITGNLDGSKLKGKIDASLIYGLLKNATIDASKVNNLKSFVEDLIPDDLGGSNGDGITDSNLSDTGFVKFGNGFLIQWAKSVPLTSDSGTRGKANFEKNFSSACYLCLMNDRGAYNTLHTFYPISWDKTSLFASSYNNENGLFRPTNVSYLAIGM